LIGEGVVVDLELWRFDSKLVGRRERLARLLCNEDELLISRLLNGLAPTTAVESRIKEFYLNDWNGDHNWMGGGAQRGLSDAKTLDQGGLVLQICYHRLISGDDRAGQFAQLVERVGQTFGSRVGVALTPVVEPQRSPLAPYSPQSRAWLDTSLAVAWKGELVGDLDAGLLVRYLRAVGLRGLLNAWYEVEHSRLSILHPIQVLESLSISATSFRPIADLLVAQAQTYGVLEELSSQVPLVADMAASVVSHGFESWLFQDSVIPGYSLGAPPDALSAAGQCWGLALFDAVAEEQMRDLPIWYQLRLYGGVATTVRYDHAIALQRRYGIRVDTSATNDPPSLFVESVTEHPFRALEAFASIARLEVVAEDLGTIPDGLRERLRRCGFFSMVVPLFRDIRAEGDLSGLVVALTTHDLPTITGLVTGADATELKLLGRDQEAAAGDDMLVSLSAFSGVSSGEYAKGEEQGVHLWDVVHPLLRGCTTRARLQGARAVWIPLEDFMGVETRVNIPGSSFPQRRNWDGPLQLDISEVCERVLMVEGLD
jgi:hypothetical protein